MIIPDFVVYLVMVCLVMVNVVMSGLSQVDLCTYIQQRLHNSIKTTIDPSSHGLCKQVTSCGGAAVLF